MNRTTSITNSTKGATAMSTTPVAPLTLQPAAAVTRAKKAAAAPTTAPAATPSKKLVNFKAWLEAESQARQVVGYDKTSVVYGKTDQEVLQHVLDMLRAMKTTASPSDLGLSINFLEELLKRKVAKQIAGANLKKAAKS